jgi:uncharacterized membrane protein
MTVIPDIVLRTTLCKSLICQEFKILILHARPRLLLGLLSQLMRTSIKYNMISTIIRFLTSTFLISDYNVIIIANRIPQITNYKITESRILLYAHDLWGTCVFDGFLFYRLWIWPLWLIYYAWFIVLRCGNFLTDIKSVTAEVKVAPIQRM